MIVVCQYMWPASDEGLGRQQNMAGTPVIDTGNSMVGATLKTVAIAAGGGQES